MRKCCIEDGATDQMDDGIDNEVLQEPSDIVLPHLHPHDSHTLPNFFLLLLQHVGSLPQVDDEQREQNEKFCRIPQEVINWVFQILFLIDRPYLVDNHVIAVAYFSLQNDVIGHGTDSNKP